MSLTESYRAIRQRLWNPPNKVDDPEWPLTRAPKQESTQEQKEAEAPNVIHFGLESLIREAQEIVSGEAEPRPRNVTLKDIRRAAEAFYQVPEGETVSERRDHPVCLARQVAMYLSKTITMRTYSAIGRAYNRDHSTVMHACRRIERLIETDSRVGDEVQLIAMRVLNDHPPADDRVWQRRLNPSQVELLGRMCELGGIIQLNELPPGTSEKNREYTRRLCRELGFIERMPGEWTWKLTDRGRATIEYHMKYASQ